jgi:hypothetical protein
MPHAQVMKNKDISQKQLTAAIDAAIPKVLDKLRPHYPQPLPLDDLDRKISEITRSPDYTEANIKKSHTEKYDNH